MERAPEHPNVRVFAPFSSMTAATFNSLKNYAPQAELVYTGGDGFAYWRELKSRWNTGSDLIIIEHDIEITADVISQFSDCPNDWCTFKYEPRIPGRSVRGISAPGYWEHSVGCVRFSASLQSRVDIATCYENVNHTNEVPYLEVDNHIFHALLASSISCHVHGIVNHYHAAADGTWIVGDPLPAIVSDPISLWIHGSASLPIWENPK